MLDVKQAVSTAEASIRALYPDSELKGLRLEEIETAKDGAHWLITFGWAESNIRQVAGSAFGISGSGVYAVPRVYKQLAIDSETGALISLKDRNL